ncbi:MdtA/MuxA family multidrug efflux RND transporter periplasmic adaptor subunit [Sulfuriferula nivalis]|uniref:Transport system membrane protein n=1 Tax=Sulfuriferula nivalis TaxID=2675298 RepID=A0A809S825_9PROT|nr:MdtA/MuxA family multidrug efflux RND transporter periplasmic adaptor subunit [Sulfuriferula nivalis]BBP00203.1 transport system membrane protein [Sulfuriferula nivalis]
MTPDDTDTHHKTMPHKSTGIFGRWWILIIVLGIAAYFIWGRDSTPKTAQTNSAELGKGGGKNATTPVGVAQAKTADVHIYLSGLGSVTPEATTTVKSRVDGQLMKINFKEGQVVKAGAVLAELDTRPYQATLAQAEGQTARDSALLQAAQIDLKRYQTLIKQDSIASQQVDTQAALVKQYMGTVQTDKGVLANAKLQLDYAHITAPISGRLGLRQVDLGNIVHASDANGIVVITQLQPITSVFSIPEDNIPAVMKQLQAGKTLSVEAWDRDQQNKLADGELVTMDNVVDSTTGTVKLKAKFPNNDYALFPNQFVNIRVLLHTRHDAIVIPTAAIQRGNNGNFVYIVKADNTISIRPVTAGPSENELTAINQGITTGETVVVDGVDKLHDGSKVKPITRSAAGALADSAKLSQGHKKHQRHDDAGVTTQESATTNTHKSAPQQ